MAVSGSQAVRESEWAVSSRAAAVAGVQQLLEQASMIDDPPAELSSGFPSLELTALALEAFLCSSSRDHWSRHPPLTVGRRSQESVGQWALGSGQTMGQVQIGSRILTKNIYGFEFRPASSHFSP